MPFGTVSANIGPICFGVSCISGELSVHLGMTREVYKHACEPTSVEIHRDRISIPDFLDRRAIGQHVEAGKPVDLEASVHSIDLRRRRFQRGGSKEECKRDRRQRGKAGEDHDRNHLTTGGSSPDRGRGLLRRKISVGSVG